MIVFSHPWTIARRLVVVATSTNSASRRRRSAAGASSCHRAHQPTRLAPPGPAHRVRSRQEPARPATVAVPTRRGACRLPTDARTVRVRDQHPLARAVSPSGRTFPPRRRQPRTRRSDAVCPWPSAFAPLRRRDVGRCGGPFAPSPRRLALLATLPFAPPVFPRRDELRGRDLAGLSTERRHHPAPSASDAWSRS